MKYAIIQIVLSVATLFIATDISMGQTYTISPNDTFQVTGIMEDLETLTISQTNTGQDTLYLKWRKVSESVPLNWEASVCDNSFCNTYLADSGMMNPVSPGDYGFLLLHITAHINFGTAVIRYAVWDINNPAIIDTLTYIMAVNSASGTGLIENNTNFILYPNPSKEEIKIISCLKTGFTYTISDLSGKEIKAGIANSNTISLSIKNIEDGVYTYSIYEKNKFIRSKQFIIYR